MASGSLNTSPANITTKVSSIKKRLPVLIYGYFRLRSFTIISIPPVVAWHLSTTPIPNATRQEPATAAISRSCVIGSYCCSTFVKKVISASAYRVERINLPPNFRIPSNKMGIFKIKNRLPVSIPVNLFTRMEMPVNPPGARSFGSRNSAIPIA